MFITAYCYTDYTYSHFFFYLYRYPQDLHLLTPSFPTGRSSDFAWFFMPIFSTAPSTRGTAGVTVRSCRDFQLLPPVATRLPNRPYCWSENRVRGQPSGHDSG